MAHGDRQSAHAHYRAPAVAHNPSRQRFFVRDGRRVQHVVGFFEPNTRLDVLTVSGESATALPRPLELAPLPGQHFWISTRDLER